MCAGGKCAPDPVQFEKMAAVLYELATADLMAFRAAAATTTKKSGKGSVNDAAHNNRQPTNYCGVRWTLPGRLGAHSAT